MKNIVISEDILRHLNMSKIEVDVYINLLQNGPMSISHISRSTKTPRTTIHENVTKLLHKGIVVQIVKGKEKCISAKDPSKLKLLLLDRKIELESEMNKLQVIEPKLMDFIKNFEYSLESNEKSRKSEHVVHTFEGKNAVLNIYKDLWDADKVYTISNLDKYYATYPNTEDRFKIAFDKNPNREVWNITLDTPLARYIEEDEKEKYPKYYCKYIDKDDELNKFDFSEYLVYDDTLALIEFSENNVFGTVIKSAYMAKNFRLLHQMVWNLL